MTNQQFIKNNTLIEIIKFGFVGVLNTIIGQLTYTLFVIIGFPYLISNVLSFIISVFHAFLWQTKFVFKEDETKEKRIWWKVLIKTYTSYAFTGLFLNSVFLILWIDIIKIENYIQLIVNILLSLNISTNSHDLAIIIAPILNMIINIPINFCLNKFWAYKQFKKI